MNVRKRDMAEWHCNTRRCGDLDSAMAVAMQNLERTHLVSIWPVYGQWMVITFTSAVVN